MPVNFRRTILFASALQVLGSKHALTAMMERLLSSSVDETEDALVDRLTKGEQYVLMDRYRKLVSKLPSNSATA